MERSRCIGAAYTCPTHMAISYDMKEERWEGFQQHRSIPVLRAGQLEYTVVISRHMSLQQAREREREKERMRFARCRGFGSFVCQAFPRWSQMPVTREIHFLEYVSQRYVFPYEMCVMQEAFPTVRFRETTLSCVNSAFPSSPSSQPHPELQPSAPLSLPPTLLEA